MHREQIHHVECDAADFLSLSLQRQRMSVVLRRSRGTRHHFPELSRIKTSARMLLDERNQLLDLTSQIFQCILPFCCRNIQHEVWDVKVLCQIPE